MKKEDFSSRYIVSEDGEIYDIEKDKKVKQFKSNKYRQCCLFDREGKKHTMGVHTVVAMFHSDYYFEGCEVHHIDEDPHNNNINNLRCMSKSNHARLHALGNYTLANYTKEHGPHNKGKKMDEMFCKKCKAAANRRYGNLIRPFEFDSSIKYI